MANRRVLNATFTDVPVVNISTGEIGSKFVGELVKSAGEVDLGPNAGVKYKYEFKVIDSDMDFVKRNEKKEYVSVDVSEGEVVTVFATKALNNALKGAKIGETIEIVYEGKKAIGNGRKAHQFDVAVLEA